MTHHARSLTEHSVEVTPPWSSVSSLGTRDYSHFTDGGSWAQREEM